MDTNQAYDRIRRKLVSLRNRFLRYEFSILALRLIGAAAGALAINVLLTYLPVGMGLRRLGAWAGIAAIILLAGTAFVILSRRWPSLAWIAAQAERETPELKGDLMRGALDLGMRKDGNPFGYSLSLIEALIADAFAKSAAIRDRDVIGRERVNRHLPILPAAIALFGLLFFFAPERTTMVFSALVPADQDELLLAVGLTVEPGSCDIESGENIKVTATFESYNGLSAFLAVKRDGEEEWREFPMGEREGVDRVFEASLRELETGAEYKIRFDTGESNVYAVTVSEPPVVTNVAFRLDFPSYTGLEPLEISENHGNVRALTGTDVELRFTANTEFSEASLVIEGADPISVVSSGRDGVARFKVTESFSYVVSFLDQNGNGNRNPILYEVTPLTDEKPFIRILYPAEDRVLDQDMVLPVQFAAIDDYGVREVNLLFRKNDNDEKKVPFFTTSHRLTEIERERDWNLGSENMLPQDVLTYYLEVWDNDEINGPKRSVSRTFTIRMPSLAQMYSELSEDQETEIDDLEEMRDASERLDKKLDELAREIQKADEISWDEKKKIEGIVEKQKEIEKNLRKVANQIEQTSREMEENRLVTPETIERLDELNRLLQEVATEEMKQAMRDLAEAMEKLDPEEIAKAAEQLQLTQEDFMERLDRTIDMLKRMKDLQDLDAIAEGMRRMAEEQRELREETEEAGADEMEDMAAQEEALQKEVDKLKEEMKKLAENSKERSEEFSKEMEKAIEKMEQQGTQQKMEEATNDLKSNEKSDAMDKQKQAEEELFQLAFQLTEYGQSCKSSSNKKVQAAFGESIQDLLYLSNGQENLADDGQSGRRASLLERRSYAERQLEVSTGIGRVMEKIREVGREVPELSAQVLNLLRRGKRKADEAARKFEEGDLSMAGTKAEESLLHLNRSVVELLRSKQNHSSSCSNPNGKGQGQQQLEQMTQQQRGLNQQSSQMPMPGGRNPGQMTMQQQAGMARLAAEQQEIRKGMEQLMEEVEGTSETLGSIDDIVEEMRKVERSLENAELSDDTRERQEKILSRMLDAQRSIRERGYKRSRRSRSAEAAEAAAPTSLPQSLSEAQEKIREDLIRMPHFSYPPEYEELIRSYFRSLTEGK